MAPRLVGFQEGMKLGFGYDLLNGAPLVSPAVQGAVSSLPEAGGQNVTSSLVRVDDLRALFESIGVNVDAGGSYFGASADVRAQYARECNMSQFATHVMVRVTVRDAFENFDDPVLTTSAHDLLTVAGLPQAQRFRERFGDVFIDGLQRGGEYFATWEIVSTDQSVRQEIAGHVEASFNDILVAAHLDVDVKNSIASSASHAEVHVHVFQNGSIDHTDQTMADIMAKARNFPPSVAGSLAVPFAVALADYRNLALPVDNFDFIQIQNQRDVLEEHAQKRFEFLTRRNSISYARQHPEEFVDADDQTLAGELSRITDAINTMERQASACLRDAGQCSFTPFDLSDFPLPRPKVTSSGPAPKGAAYVAGASGITVLDANDVVLTTIPIQNATAIAMAPNGRRVYLALDGKIAAIDTATNDIAATIMTNAVGRAIALTPDGKLAYACCVGPGARGTLLAIDATTNTIVATIPMGDGGLNGIAITPDGRRAYAVKGTNVAVIDTGSNSIMSEIRIDRGQPGWLELAPDGQHAYVGLDESPPVIIDTSSDQVMGEVRMPEPASGVAFSPDGKLGYFGQTDVDSTDNPTGVRIVNLATNSVIDQISLGDGATFGVATTHDGKLLYVTQLLNRLTIINTAAKTVVDRLTLSGASAIAVAR
jgi:DNA-binding beta-propeller fold protein YncE